VTTGRWPLNLLLVRTGSRKSLFSFHGLDFRGDYPENLLRDREHLIVSGIAPGGKNHKGAIGDHRASRCSSPALLRSSGRCRHGVLDRDADIALISFAHALSRLLLWRWL